jgi:hypothetical protein
MRIAPLAAAVLVLALAGCTPGTGTADPTTDPAPTESVTPAAPQPALVVVSLTGLTIQDDAGGTVQTADFTDADATLALVSGLLGSTPTPTVNADYGTSVWEWPDVQLGSSGPDYSWLRVSTATLGGLPVQTPDGIHVGSSLADVEAVGPFDDGYDSDGDGTSDILGVDQVPNPDQESLSLPGQPGTDFVALFMNGGAVTEIQSPSNDYSDV